MNRFFAAFALFATLLILPAAAKPPNILFIIVDDLGYGDLSSYGATDLKTPHIDGLIADGMRFDHFYANCPVCSPSRASVLTGLYPDKAGVPGVVRTPLDGKTPNWGDLRDDVAVFPQLLKDAGYHTACVGKWHLGLEAPDIPTRRGFDHFHGWLGDMMDDYYKHTRHGFPYMRLQEELIHPEGHATDLFSDWAVDYIKDRESTAPDQPWYLYLAYNAPHTPIQPPQDWFEKVKAREDGITDQRAKLVALIEHMDHGIGQVLEHVKSAQLEEETLIVFTSDNGGQVNVGGLNGALNGGKQDMWEGGIRVCTGVKWKGTIEKGSKSDFVGIGMDFFPTLAEIAGAKVEEPIDGVSFAPVLLGKDWEAPQRPLFWVRLEGNQKYGGLPYHAARIGDWKLLRNHSFEPYKMFNLANDPGEQNEIPRQKAPAKYNELFNALMMHINTAGKIPWQRVEEHE